MWTWGIYLSWSWSPEQVMSLLSLFLHKKITETRDGIMGGLWHSVPHQDVMLAGEELVVTVSPLAQNASFHIWPLKSCRCSPCRAFFLALFKHLMFLEKRGCPRTALEFCKLILR